MSLACPARSPTTSGVSRSRRSTVPRTLPFALHPLTARELRLVGVFESERPGTDGATALIGADRYAGRRGFRADEFQRGGNRAFAEQSLAGAEHEREGQQPELVDQIVLQQCLD